MHGYTKQLLKKCWILMLLLVSGCAGIGVSPTSWQMPTLSSKPLTPGTSAWWKKHKEKAEFVPGEGYQVAGFEGYYDSEGRPIGANVAKLTKSEKGQGLLHDTNVVASFNELKNQVGLGPNQQLAQEAFAEGEELFRKQEFTEAAKQFKEAISRWPNSKIEPDAMYYLAESQFFAKEYPDAVDSYGELLKKYPNTAHLNKVIRRQFSIAQYWEKHYHYDPNWPTTPNLLDDTRPWFDTLGNALKTYESIRLNDPTGPLADAAIMATANSYFLRGRYSDADYQYQLIREEYPQSEHQFEAHILGLQCKLRKYQGPDYDAKPLLEAKKLAKQLKQQFRGELSKEEKQRLAAIENQLYEELATRDYNLAQYYDDTKHFESAQFYYAKLIKEYPETTLASQARERYLELEGKPAHPETKMEWLVELFPENAERKAIAQIPMTDSESQVNMASRQETEGSEADGNTLFR